MALTKGCGKETNDSAKGYWRGRLSTDGGDGSVRSEREERLSTKMDLQIVRAERKSTESNAKRVDFMEVGVGPVVH